MSAQSIPGPRAPRSSSDTRAAGFQFTALSTEVKVRIPKDWRHEFVQISWLPGTPGDVLYYLFAPEPEPPGTLPAIDSTTASSVGGGAEPAYSVVTHAPDWIESGACRVQVPAYTTDTLLLLKSSGAAGRVKVRQAEGP